jgi:signal transduction histidine kinase
MNDEPIKVLLVEGDADESALIARLLQGPAEPGERPLRFVVAEAPRLTSATHLLGNQDFDAALLDLTLPRSVGLEAFHKLRSQRPGLPVVVLTGLRDLGLAEDAVRQGAHDYLVKGALHAGLLRRAVRQAVERQRLLDEVDRLRQAAPPAPPADPDGRDALIRKVSHDLRNTVTTVKAAVYCLSDGLPDPLTPKQRQLVAMISRNVDRQVKTVDDVLDLSRLRAGKRKAELETVEPGALAEELAREAALRGSAKPLSLDLPCRLPSVPADPELLGQALRQLLDNAFRHAASAVTLRVEPDGDGVLFTVADDGAGVPPERLDSLFADFSRGEAVPGAPRGSGLGLAICREIANAHGGRVWAENGQPGARFRLRLPGAPRPAAAAEPARRKHPSPALQAPSTAGHV